MPSYIKFSNNDYTLHNDKKIDIDSLYKKCGFKKEENFIKLFSYNSGDNTLEFWGRNKGDTKTLNTYNLEHYKFKDNIYGKFLCLIKNGDEYITFDEEYFKNIDSNIYNIYNKTNDYDKTVTMDEANDSDDNLSTSDEEDNSSDSEPVYDSELQYEEYDYSD